MGYDLKIHGSLFLLLKKFIESDKGQEMWLRLKEEAGVKSVKFEMHENYPLYEFNAIIFKASSHYGLSETDIKEKFGESLVPDLLHIYKKYIDPTWKTFDILQNTEKVMHNAVRTEESKAAPPVLNVSKVHDKLLIIDYHSERKMGSLAVGIIKGIAKYYKEDKKVKVLPITNPNADRVQIRIEFE